MAKPDNWWVKIVNKKYLKKHACARVLKVNKHVLAVGETLKKKRNYMEI